MLQIQLFPDYTTTFCMAGTFFIVAGIVSEIAHLIYFFKAKRRERHEDEGNKI